MTRQHRIALAVVAVLIVGCAGFVAWRATRGPAAGDVTVAWADGSPSCRGAKISGATSSRPVIEGERGMRCVVTVRVTNASAGTVHVVRAVAPGMGPRGIGVARAVNAEHAPRGSTYDADALITVDRDLAAGRSTTFDVVLALRLTVCDERPVYLSDWPTVTVTAQGRSIQRDPGRTVGIRGGGVPGCRE